MSVANHMQRWLGCPRQVMLALLLLLTPNRVSSANDLNKNFCRRFQHQSTVIDDKLYIDGGWVNYEDFKTTGTNYSNDGLGYHDLNHTVERNSELWPELKIGLDKNESVPTVSGGILWPDAVNKRFYLYGGEWNEGYPTQNYRLKSYDIINDWWDDFGEPDLSSTPNISAFGAGVGVSEMGMGYYYGGWISDKSMNKGPKQAVLSSEFYSYDYEEKKFTSLPPIPSYPSRAEGGMVWIPLGDAQGLLVYLGGVMGTDDNGTAAAQPLNEIFVFDAQAKEWYMQKTTGLAPQNRRQFCMDVAWAPDKSSFNIYLWGGAAVHPPDTDADYYGDIYTLTLPSFTWVKIFPDPKNTNATNPDPAKYGASCNMVKGMSQLMVIGGTKDDATCDGAPAAWAMHNLWTGTLNNEGDNETYWALYDPNVTTNVVPYDIYNVIGGDKNGGAKVVNPKNGFNTTKSGLGALMTRRPKIPERTPTRDIPGATSSSTSDSDNGTKLGAGAIAGIAIGGVAALAIILFLWYRFGKSVLKRREERRQLEVTQQAQQMQQAQQAQLHAHQSLQAQQTPQSQHPHYSYYGGSTTGSHSVVTPQSPPAGYQWDAARGHGSPDLHPPMAPTELPTDYGQNGPDKNPPAY